MSTYFYQTTRHHIPKDSNFQAQENLQKKKNVTLKIGDGFTPHFKEYIHSLRRETNFLQFCTRSLIWTEATRFLQLRLWAVMRKTSVLNSDRSRKPLCNVQFYARKQSLWITQ